MTNNNYPTLVNKLIRHCEGWIIGEAAEPEIETVAHYEIVIPPQHWPSASGYIPLKAKPNRLGGLVVDLKEVKVTVWTGDINDIFTSNLFTFAYHPKSGVRIIRLNKEDM